MPAKRLPKFLICHDEKRDFVLHCEFPRMLIEFGDNTGKIVIQFDSNSAISEAGHKPGKSRKEILRAAREFFVEEMLDDGFDDEFDDEFDEV